MQYFIRIMCIIVMLLLSTTLKSQTILSHTLLPSNPNSNEMISLSLQTGFNYSNCSLTNYFVSMNGNTISVVANYQTGILTVLCDRTDILFISNSLPAGTYIVNISTFVNGPLSGTDNVSFSFNVNNQIDLCSGVNIDDGNPCTIDACDPSTGTITHTLVNIDDNDVCTSDGCNSSTGVYHIPVNTNDDNACTTDGCDPATGQYHIPVDPTDFIDCTIDACNTLTGEYTHVEEPPTISVASGEIKCYGSTACVTVTATGGLPPYFQTGEFCGYSAGTFLFSVIDSRGCVADSTIYISEPSKLTVQIQTTLSNGSDGTATAFVSGGTQPYSYLWTPDGQTTEIATGLAPGNYCIKIIDLNSCSVQECFPIDPSCQSSAPGPISGPTGVCAKQIGLVYCVTNPNPSATSYLWTLPAGVSVQGASMGPCITLKFSTKFKGGYICSKAITSCGTTAYACLNVVLITKKPVTPGTISGPSSLCPNVAATYSIIAVPNAKSYLWSVPSNMQILSGQGSTSILVKALSNFNGGSVKVKAVNCKDFSGSKTKNISKATVCRESTNPSVIISKSLSELSVFPNPTSGKLTVSFFTDTKSKYILKIIDLLGKNILIERGNAIEGDNINELDLGNVTKGMYFLIIEKEGVEKKTFRIIVE